MMRVDRCCWKSALHALLLIAWLVMPGAVAGAGTLALFDFEEERELDFLHWKCGTFMERDRRHASSGAFSLRVEMYGVEEYPGVQCAVLDGCRGAKRLLADIYNPGEQFTLSWRIDDRPDNPDYEERANGRIVLRPGANTFVVDLEQLRTAGGRPMRAATISKVSFFVRRVTTPLVIFLDYLRVEQ